MGEIEGEGFEIGDRAGVQVLVRVEIPALLKDHDVEGDEGGLMTAQWDGQEGEAEGEGEGEGEEREGEGEGVRRKCLVCIREEGEKHMSPLQEVGGSFLAPSTDRYCSIRSVPGYADRGYMPTNRECGTSFLDTSPSLNPATPLRRAGHSASWGRDVTVHYPFTVTDQWSVST